jgi:hypothetical protein
MHGAGRFGIVGLVINYCLVCDNLQRVQVWTTFTQSKQDIREGFYSCALSNPKAIK